MGIYQVQVEFARFQGDPEVWHEELGEVLRHAGRLGLRRILFIWAASIGFPAPRRAPNVYSSRGFSPYDPEDGPIWQEHLQQRVSYAPFLEEVLTHWEDPGGYKGATIEDAQKLHMEIWGEFQKHNPSIGSIFSLWMLHSGTYGKWKGYQGTETILNSDILPKEVSLAMHARVNMQEARVIKEAGRRCGPWVWYLADNEIIPGLHVHTGWMEEYFQSLPQEASQLVDFHGIELNCHQLNLASVYVGSRKLWNPYGKADDYLSEFCHLVFGPEVGDIVCNGYQAVAYTRCIDDYGHRDKILALVNADYGKEAAVENPLAEKQEVNAALEKLERASPDPNWIPRLPLPVSPEQMIEDLKIHLSEIGKYAQFRIDLLAVRDGKKSPEELSDWERPDGYLLDPEQQRVRQHMRELAKKKGARKD